jgi:hypothetical protein
LKVANKEMELVKKNLNEIDLAGLEGSLKQYTDTAVSSISQPDLSEYLTRTHVLVVPSLPSFPGEDENPFKDGNKSSTYFFVNILLSLVNAGRLLLRVGLTLKIVGFFIVISLSLMSKNDIYIGGSFTNTSTITYDSQNVVIGHGAKNDRFKNILIGNNAQTTSGYSTVFGYNVKGYTHSVAIGSDAQATYLCSIAIGSNCVNSSNYSIKFWAGASTTVSDLAGVDFGNSFLT